MSDWKASPYNSGLSCASLSPQSVLCPQVQSLQTWDLLKWFCAGPRGPRGPQRPQRTNLTATEPHRNGKWWCPSMSLLEVFVAPTLLVITYLTSVCFSWLHALISAGLAHSWVLSTKPSAWSYLLKKQTAGLVEGVHTWMFFGAAGPPCLLEAICSEADSLATYPV